MPKTALMGSPLAVIGTVFRHRRTLAKTGAAVGGVLMLPMLFLVMLPGLVFGDLSENTGALTSNTVISENIRASNQAIVEVLQESHDALLAKINAEIARLPEGDTASISDPYASSIIVNANQLIAQFCASQDDYKNINISKLKSLIRENEDGLFLMTLLQKRSRWKFRQKRKMHHPERLLYPPYLHGQLCRRCLLCRSRLSSDR